MRDAGTIVVGGGHAGVEAALAAARLGVPTLLVTGDPEKICTLPCNPSIGGSAKGQLVREIDALGGAMGAIADRCSLHARFLNESKGPSVRALRQQMDKPAYARLAISTLRGHRSTRRPAAGEARRLAPCEAEAVVGVAEVRGQGGAVGHRAPGIGVAPGAAPADPPGAGEGAEGIRQR